MNRKQANSIIRAHKGAILATAALPDDLIHIPISKRAAYMITRAAEERGNEIRLTRYADNALFVYADDSDIGY